MKTTAPLTTKYQTIRTTGYQHSVNPHNENRAAHGGVCYTEAKRDRDGTIRVRWVNANGRHREVSESVVMDPATFARRYED